MDDVPPPVTPVHSLKSPQTVFGLFGMVLVAGAMAGAFFHPADSPLVTQVVTAAMTFGGMILGFYFGASVGSQSKDAGSSLPAPPVLPPEHL